jgi:uncharacterized phage-associated protein
MENEEDIMNRGQSIAIQPDFNLEKAIEATGYLLQLYGIQKPINFMRILKLLYLADRKALEDWERPITYDTYVSMKHGQVLSNTYDFMKRQTQSEAWDKYFENKFYYWISLKEPIKLNCLSPAEIELLEQIYNKYGDYNMYDLAQMTHDLPEYVDPGDSSIITPMDNLLRSLSYDEDEIERIIEELHSEASVDLILGV